jgi:diacylglycerol kinase family enzyme
VEKVLLISNARAGSVSARTKEVIVKALSADFKLEVADTEARDHATELARDAVDRDFDAVLVFGGDGTINEAAQPLVGSDISLGILPGGSTNVMARSLGIPRDPVEATAFLASHLRTGTKRRVNVGRANDRYFLFSAGMGLDAEVVRRVEADPEAKRRRGEMLFVSNAFGVGFKQYRGADPMITLEIEGTEPARVLLAVCCNARPFTYFKRFPVDVCPTASLDGRLTVFALTKIRTGTIPRIVWGLFVSRSHVRWRISRYHDDIGSFRLTADHPVPMQVDGDYVGEWDGAQVVLVEEAVDLLV